MLSSRSTDSWRHSILGKETEDKKVHGEIRGSVIRVHPSDDVHRPSQSSWSKTLAVERKQSVEIVSYIADENKKLSGLVELRYTHTHTPCV